MKLNTYTIKTYLLATLILISIVAIITNLVTAMTFIYPLITRHLDLDIITGLDHGTLLSNYRIVIHYILFPWVTHLCTPDFTMSATGVFHFWEVKVIYHVMQVIGVIFIGSLYLALKKKLPLLHVFNATANLIVALFGTILVGMLIDFDFFFYWFHRLFFNNDYWIFNPRYDPIILAMPYQLFLIMGIIIIAYLFIIAGVIKYIYHLRLNEVKK